MGSVLAEIADRVNPRPVAWWGSEDDVAFEKLSAVFAGRTLIQDEGPRLKHVCANHNDVAATPVKYTEVVDAASRISAVHACSLNGYVETLRVLLDDGGADFSATTSDGFTAKRIAQLRQHHDIVELLDRAEEKRLATLTQPATEDDLADAARQTEDLRLSKQCFVEPTRIEATTRHFLADERARARERQLRDDARYKIGVVPVRRERWKGIDIDVDDRQPSVGLGYYPLILR